MDSVEQIVMCFPDQPNQGLGLDTSMVSLKQVFMYTHVIFHKPSLRGSYGIVLIVRRSPKGIQGRYATS